MADNPAFVTDRPAYFSEVQINGHIVSFPPPDEWKQEYGYFKMTVRIPQRHDEAHLLKLIELGLRNNLMNDVAHWTRQLDKLRNRSKYQTPGEFLLNTFRFAAAAFFLFGMILHMGLAAANPTRWWWLLFLPFDLNGLRLVMAPKKESDDE